MCDAYQTTITVNVNVDFLMMDTQWMYGQPFSSLVEQEHIHVNNRFFKRGDIIPPGLSVIDEPLQAVWKLAFSCVLVTSQVSK